MAELSAADFSGAGPVGTLAHCLSVFLRNAFLSRFSLFPGGRLTLLNVLIQASL